MHRITSILTTLLYVSLLYSQPKANFYANPQNGCTPATIKFTNSSSGSGLTYFWDLGNGNTSVYQNPQAIYYTPGFYTIKLVVTDNNGKSDSIIKSKYIEVFKNPVADFDAQYTTGCVPFDPIIIDKSVRGSAMITNWTWDYGDGTVKTGSKPSYYYSKEKVYDISLIIKDANGCVSDKSKKQYITVYNAPQVMFSADKVYNCSAPLTVNFKNSTINSSGSWVCNWDFGDGTKSNDKNPQKTYNDTGSYNVSLKVISSYGCTSTLTFGDFINIKKLIPVIQINRTRSCTNDYINYKNISKTQGSKILSKWDMGDGTIKWGFTVSHFYKNAGKYLVKLTMMQSDSSCKQTVVFKDSLTILKKPKANFYISDTLICDLSTKDTLIDKSEGGTSRKWFINGNYLSDKKGVIFTLPNYQRYSVTLISSNLNCSDTLVKDSLINVIKIKPKIEISPDKGCYPLKVNFRDITNSKLKIKSRLWDLGDGGYQSDSSFEYTYTKPGIYIVRLTIKTEIGCSFTTTDTVRVGQKPKISFSYPKTAKCNSDTVLITNVKIANNVKVDEWNWFLDDVAVSDKRDLNIKLKSKPDTFDIKLVAGNFGCYETFILKNILIVKPPLVQAFALIDSCKGFPKKYYNTSLKADVIKWRMSDGSWVHNKDSIIVKTPNEIYPLTLWGTNSNSGCTDSFSPIYNSWFYYLSFDFWATKCLPVTINVSNTSFYYSNFKWNWGDGNIEYSNSLSLNHSYTKPGDYSIKLVGKSTGGCIDSVIKKLKVVGPDVYCTVFPKSACGTLNTNLITNSKAKGVKKMYWVISNNTKIDVVKDTMKYTFNEPGTIEGSKYSIKLVVEDSAECINIYNDTVTVNGISFHFDASSVYTCTFNKNTILPVFDKNVNTNKFKYIWELGDGRTLYGSVINFMYKSEGNYNLKLTVVDDSSCVSGKDTIINNSFKTLNSDFIADNLESNCPPLRVNFISKSKSNLGTIVKYMWDFGDGSTSEIKDPSHLYLKSGKFTVKLIVRDNFGCTDTIVYKDLILIDGPIGSFSFDRKKGCTPLSVNFISEVKNTYQLEWDMGDGMIIKDTTNASHIYTRIGNYIPLLVLSDSFGCKYTLPPIDTIEVCPIPIAMFSHNTPCLNQVISFKNNSKPLKGYIKKSIWLFGDGDSSTEFEPYHIFKNKGTYTVRLTVWNNDSCFSETSKQIVIKKSEANFEPEKQKYCEGQIPKIKNLSNSDTSFSFFKWFLNDSLLSHNFEPTLPALNFGIYNVKLISKDDFGCYDTVSKNSIILVGKKTTPNPLDIYRVTVENDNSVLIQFKPSNEYDFERYNIYTSHNGKKINNFTSKNRFDTSIVIKNLNTLSNAYCLKITNTNFCEIESEIEKSPEHCTIENKAMGEISIIKLKWNAYKGWNVKNYEIFRENLSQKGNYEFLSVVPGNQLYYNDTTVLCKTTHFYKIKAIENDGNYQISWSDTTAAKAIYENSVPPNSIIRATVDFDKVVTIEWNGSGTPRIPVKEYILEKSENGINYSWYKSFSPQEFDFTDKIVKVDNKSFFYRTYAIDTCENRSPYINYGKTILLKADTNIYERPILSWSTYKGWHEGVNQYEIQRKNSDGTFSSIGFVSNFDSTFTDDITDLNNYPYYCYRVIGYKISQTGEKQIISVSNEDCAPVRSRIFAANAFTINHDGLNETFDIKGLYIKEYNIRIFTRWGEKVFESNDMNYDWDGAYKDSISQMDTYIWIIEAIGVDSLKWQLKGTVTVIR